MLIDERQEPHQTDRERRWNGCIMAKREQWTKGETSDSSNDDNEEVQKNVWNDENIAIDTFHVDTDSASCNALVAKLAGYDRLAGDYKNQDYHILTSPWKDLLLLGVMDGHDQDGDMIAQLVQQELPKRLAEKVSRSAPTNENDVALALKQVFCDINHSLPKNTVGGSTASIALQWGTKLILANAGDSISLCAVVRNRKDVTAMYCTRQDRPNLPEERHRIEQMGGRVSSCCSRIIYQDSTTGEWKPGVAMSRSIGDRDMIGVISEPLVDILDINELVTNNDNDKNCYILVISTTDGMTDCMTPMELAVTMADAFSSDETNPIQKIKELVCRAANMWNERSGGSYRDDITIVACKTELKDKMTRDESND